MSKVLKSKCLVFGQFWSKSDNSSSSWWATVQILKEKYLHHIFAKNVASIGKKTCCWCQWNFKFGTQTNYIKLRKKPQNNFFHWGQHHCESGIWNIQIFFVIFFIVQNIWCFFEASVQLVPTILFTSCLQTAWTAIDFL